MAQRLVKYGALVETNTAFFLCDIQEKFRNVILHFKEMVEVVDKLVQFSKILKIPLIVTEQHPKGLGKTVAELNISHAYGVYEKTKFSMVIPEVIAQLPKLCGGQLESVVLFGIEAHICIDQTAMELLARGIQVHIVADACSSRSQQDRILAFQRLNKIGCFITTFENVLFKILGDKNHPQFTQVRQFVKTTSANTGLAGGISKI